MRRTQSCGAGIDIDETRILLANAMYSLAGSIGDEITQGSSCKSRSVLEPAWACLGLLEPA